DKDCRSALIELRTQFRRGSHTIGACGIISRRNNFGPRSTTDDHLPFSQHLANLGRCSNALQTSSLVGDIRNRCRHDCSCTPLIQHLLNFRGGSNTISHCAVNEGEYHGNPSGAGHFLESFHTMACFGRPGLPVPLITTPQEAPSLTLFQELP